MSNMTIALAVSNALTTILLAWAHSQKWKYANALDEMCKAGALVISGVFEGDTRVTAKSEVHMNRLENARNRAMVLLGKRMP